MGNKLVLAVAGSGKTQFLLSKAATTEARSLYVTFTKRCAEDAENRFDEMESRGEVRFYTFFSFLSQEVLRPQGRRFDLEDGSFELDYGRIKNRKVRKNTKDYFFSPEGKLYAKRASLLAMRNEEQLLNAAQRIDRFYGNFFFDEFQDLASHDFEFICSLANACRSTQFLFVGDFYQHIYDTSQDGNKNKNLHADLESYRRKLAKLNVEVDEGCLSSSYRCPPAVCDYIEANLGISIATFNTKKSKVVEVPERSEAESLLLNDQIPKLFRQSYQKFRGHTQNWGRAKGIDSYQDVAIVISQSIFQKMKNKDLPAQTRNKLYVAMSRCRGDLYFIDSKIADEILGMKGE